MIDLNEVFLTPGYHENHDGYCVMEAAAAYSNLSWTDEPETVNRDIARLCRALNDWISSDQERQELKQLIPRLILTSGSYSQFVHKQIDELFTFDATSEQYAFTVPENPIDFLEALLDQLLFEVDMKNLELVHA